MSTAADSLLLTAAPERASDAEAIRPFRVNAPEDALVDLRRRILATRWPEKETVGDDSQGVPLARLRVLAEFWASDYDWRRCEAQLNALPQFLTRIDGLDIHFIHVRSRHAGALPMVVSHGWPGSVLEHVKGIGPLTDPVAHGGRAEDAFDVVIPSLPGFGFSGKPSEPGWDPGRIARAWVVLMKRLGYARFVAQGGDWGAVVTDALGVLAPPELMALHTNMPAVVPADISRAIAAGEPPPAGLSADERRAYEEIVAAFGRVAYARLMGTRPQTIGYSLSDSPVGLAAWFYEKFVSWTDSGGEPERVLTRDEMLDDITLAWLANTGTSSGRLYWENKLAYFDAKGITVPAAVSVFPGELYRAPRSWTERAYRNLIHFGQPDRGGHFAAWEQPQLFVEELRAAFRSLR